MVKFYTQYWRDNMDIVLDGNFKAHNPLGNYPILKAEKDGKAIVGVYDEVVMSINGEQKIYILNAKQSESIVIKNTGKTRTYKITARDCKGNISSEELKELPAGISEIAVPKSGVLSLEYRQ
ncbi:MAG: hypothetical protein AAFP82_08610, partial [Bacteroidota bacterium]